MQTVSQTPLCAECAAAARVAETLATLQPGPAVCQNGTAAELGRLLGAITPEQIVVTPAVVTDADKLAQVQAVALDHLDYDTHGLHFILNVIGEPGYLKRTLTDADKIGEIRAACEEDDADRPWAQEILAIVGPSPEHETTVDVGGPSNFVVRCSCGYTNRIASTNPDDADARAREHVAAFTDDPAEGFGWLPKGPR